MKKQSRKGIVNWPKSERPRERLLQEGPESLSDAQLLAILLRVGRQDSSAVQVAIDLLHHLEGLQGLANRSLEELCAVPGIGPAKAAQVKAAIELGKRVLSTPLTTGMKIANSQSVFQHYYPLLRDLRHEVFKVMLLDAKHAVIRDITVSEGSLTTSVVHPREVFNEAVRESAAAVIFLHNHPSGDPKPSAEDRTLTARLQEAGHILGIQVLDHVIIGDGRFVSFADEGWLGASKQAVNPGADFGPYGLPKAATLFLMRQYAVDHGADGIRANAVNADRIRSGLLTDEMIETRSKARGLSRSDYMSGNLLGREVTADDVARAFVDLALAEKTTGAVLTVDGGNIAAALR